MTVFVDASVLVAILGGEEDAFDQAARVRDADDPICSPIAVWEAVTSLCRSFRYTPALAQQAVDDMFAAGGIRLVNIGEREARIALEAYTRYGKGRDPAGLNMGDCFAYACAKAHEATLLYKGNDFAKTDLA